jgi:hypothetical protein
MTAVTLNIFFLRPALEKNYLHDDIKAIERSAVWVVLILAGILFLIATYYFVKQFEHVTAIPGFVFNLIMLAIPMYFFLTPFVQSGIMLLNEIKKNNYTIKEFEAHGMVGEDAAFFLYDPEKKTQLYFDDQHKIAIPSNHKNGDMIRVQMATGLLGFIVLR